MRVLRVIGLLLGAFAAAALLIVLGSPPSGHSAPTTSTATTAHFVIAAEDAGGGGVGHAFWSGDGTESAATAFAEENGGTTLGMTAEGQATAQEAEGLPWSQARPLWAKASQQFAESAQGTRPRVSERGWRVARQHLGGDRVGCADGKPCRRANRLPHCGLNSMPLTMKVLAREALLLRDGEDWMAVQCAWGVEPSLAFLPPADRWKSAVPAWLRERRPEVVHVIEEFGFQVRDDNRPLSPTAFGRGDSPDPAKGPIAQVTTLDAIPIEELRRRRGGDRP